MLNSRDVSSIPADASSIFTNGAKQTAFFMYEMLTYQGRHKVWHALYMPKVKGLMQCRR